MEGEQAFLDHLHSHQPVVAGDLALVAQLGLAALEGHAEKGYLIETLLAALTCGVKQPAAVAVAAADIVELVCAVAFVVVDGIDVVNVVKN